MFCIRLDRVQLTIEHRAACFRLRLPKAFFFFSSRRRHTRCLSDWSSDVCSSDLSAPERTFMSVDLPAPFSPTRAMTSPSLTSRSTPSSATVGPKRLRTPLIVRRTLTSLLPEGGPLDLPLDRKSVV